MHAASRRLTALTLDNLEDLSRPCRSCVSWELDPVAAQRAQDSGDVALEKEAWLSAVLLEWGSCGFVAYTGSQPIGHVLYAPPSMVPRAASFPTSPVSPDAILLVTAFVQPEQHGAGVGRSLVQAAAKDLLQRGTRAIEAFGDARWERPACLLPAEYLSVLGFQIVRPHDRWPRFRLDLRSTLNWREDVEVAVERILGSVVREPALRPV
ncbi:MAG TPA: GNAT family N-acetyltransferase [Jiangellaceae bacterium]|nr:GNAT family N-acetyltransferase [Jiangellaceae bacterium]